MKNISKNSKQRLLEVMSKVNGLNLNENYPMGAEYDPQAPYNQKNNNELWNDEKVVEPEEFDPYDKHKDDSMDDSMDETPDDGIDRNNPHYQIGGLTTQYNNLLGEIKKLYEYINKNNPSINVVGAIIEAIISRQDKMQTPEDNLNVDESKWGKTRANPKYTHFAVLKDNNKIVTGWEYRGYDPEELRLEKKHYFLNDVKDLQVDPKIVKIVTTKALQKLGIDPYDYNNWSKDDSIFTLEENNDNGSNFEQTDEITSGILSIMHGLDDNGKSESFIAHNNLDGHGWKTIRKLTGADVRFIKSKGFDFNNDYSKKGLDSILKQLLNNE